MLIWTIGHGEWTAHVAENGHVDGGPPLVAILEAKLREPITVFRHGTISDRGATNKVIDLSPGDGRYVVARVRRLCADEAAFAILGCEWR